MAVPTGSGTEIMKSVWLDNVDAAPNGMLILGAQHHIYTVVSIIVYCEVVSSTASENTLTCRFVGFDTNAGASAQTMYAFQTPQMVVGETYVFDNKFSFFGCEPDWSGASGQMTTIAEQALLAAQGTSTSQYLDTWGGGSTCKFSIGCTYIDQDWT